MFENPEIEYQILLVQGLFQSGETVKVHLLNEGGDTAEMFDFTIDTDANTNLDAVHGTLTTKDGGSFTATILEPYSTRRRVQIDAG